MENVKLEEMTWQDRKAALEETDLVILPIGAMERHGPHLVRMERAVKQVPRSSYGLSVFQGSELVNQPASSRPLRFNNSDFLASSKRWVALLLKSIKLNIIYLIVINDKLIIATFPLSDQLHDHPGSKAIRAIILRLPKTIMAMLRVIMAKIMLAMKPIK